MRTSKSRLAFAGVLCGTALLSACVTVPSGPSVMVLPGTNKSFDQFQADGFACNQYAQQMTGNAGQAATDAATANAVAGTVIGAAAGASYYQVQRRYDQAYVQCMYAKGNQVPVGAGYRGPPPRMAPPGYLPPAG